MIVIQTEAQCEMMKAFSSQRVICVDATHGTNMCGYLLITVLVVDDFGEGCPVAWCISNREDKQLLCRFFQAIKGKVGQLSPRWFMSDDAPQYYGAWIDVFNSEESVTSKLLCNWHVERSWQRRIKMINSSELEQEVYHQLKTLVECKVIADFEQMLDAFLHRLKSTKASANFGSYFEKEYYARKEEWAICYRLGSTLTPTCLSSRSTGS